jgi:hypothetical protein
MESLTEDQRTIYQNIKEGKNVIVDAIAGSGKSTTIVSIAKLLPEKSFLQITYNSMLRKEFKEKVEKNDIHNINVHTYHSFAVKYFARDAYTDIKLREIVNERKETIEEIPKYDIVVIDECQDMTHLYFQLMTYVLEIISSSSSSPSLLPKSPPQLLILGDYMQCLYEFKGADARYLTMADKIWKTPYEFTRCQLKVSYRITNQMCDFINCVMLGERRMNACREGSPVTYIRNNTFNIENIVKNHILQIIKFGDLPDDIFILAPSVKGVLSQNIKRIENALVEQGIPCYVPTRDSDFMVDEKVIQGKVVFTTFHSVKGRQRKYVFIMNFDNSYFTYFDRKNEQKNTCPNTLYVAATRATNKLFLLEINQKITDRPLPFLKLYHDEMRMKSYIDFKGIAQKIFWKNEHSNAIEKEKTRKVVPTELIQFIPESILDEILPILKRVIIQENAPEKEIDIPNILVLNENGIYEDVSDINGIAIPCIYYDYIYSLYNSNPEQKDNKKDANRINVLYDFITFFFENLKEGEHELLRNIYTELKPQCNTPEEYLFLSNVYLAFQDKLYYKIKQIDKQSHKWMTEDMMKECIERMESTIRKKITTDNEVTREEIVSFEQMLIHPHQEEKHFIIDKYLDKFMSQQNEKYRFSCRLDLITTHHIWELKFVKEISIEHLLQFVIYVWLWKCVENERKDFGYKILNIRTNETYVVQEKETTMDDLTQIILLLLKGKYGDISSSSVGNDLFFPLEQS